MGSYLIVFYPRIVLNIVFGSWWVCFDVTSPRRAMVKETFNFYTLYRK